MENHNTTARHALMATMASAAGVLCEAFALWLLSDVGIWSVLVYLGASLPILMLGSLGLFLSISGMHAVLEARWAAPETPWVKVAWRWMHVGAPEVCAKRAGAIAAAGLGLGAWVAAFAIMAQHMIAAINTPALLAISLALLGIALAVATSALMSWPLVIIQKALTALARHDAIAPFVRPSTLLLSGLLGASALALRSHEFIHATPWHLAAGAFGAGVALLVVDLFARSRARILTLGSWAVIGTLAAGAFFLPASASSWTRLLEHGGSSLSLTHHAIVDRLDADGDGHTPYYGDRDCAPDDPSRNPGALDIPSNGIDEDCSGSDLTSTFAMSARGARHHALPADYKERVREQKPDVIIITVDAVSMDHTSIGGHARDLTPALAEFASASIVYEDAFATGPSTRLSFPSLMASTYNSLLALGKKKRHPFKWGQDTVTLAEVMKREGYRTVFLPGSKYFSRKNWPGLAQGFDTVEVAPTRLTHTSEWLTRRALHHLDAAKNRTRSQDKPLFLWVHYYDPHQKYVTPPKSAIKGTSEQERYNAELAYTDASWRALLERVREDKSIAALTADHGEVFGRKGTKHHHGFKLDTRVLHIPFVIHVPGAAPRRVSGLVSQLDLATTIVNLIDAKPPEAWLGESLVDTILGNATPEKSFVMGLFYLPERANKKKDAFGKISLRTMDYYLVEEIANKRSGLYHWRDDPDHEHDLAATRPDQYASLRHGALSELKSLREKERGLSSKGLKKKRKEKKTFKKKIKRKKTSSAEARKGE